MGLLDDAIREHLELKRRSGADASELARLERDAFGAGTPEPVEDAAHEPHADAASVATADDPFGGEAAPEPPPERAHEPLPEPEQPTRQFTLEEIQEAERREAPPEPEQAREPEPEPEPEPRASEPPPAAPVPGPADEPADHDELEETPEFLQETPEHDKLWFEQKPPKDFDF